MNLTHTYIPSVASSVMKMVAVESSENNTPKLFSAKETLNI